MPAIPSAKEPILLLMKDFIIVIQGLCETDYVVFLKYHIVVGFFVRVIFPDAIIAPSRIGYVYLAATATTTV